MRTAMIPGLVLMAALGSAVAQEAQPQTAEDIDFLDALIQEPEAAEPATPQAQEPAAGPQAEQAQPPSEELDVIPVAVKEEPQPAMAEAKPAPQIEEIVVTATKRAEPVRDIPITIDVLSGKDLEREGVQGLEQITALVPGVNLTAAGDGNPARVTIRGVSSDANTNFTAGTVFGDIPFTDPFIPKVQLDPNPFDLATVEILKGPQGTLFGGTGLNGLVRYVPQAPELDQFRLKYYTQFSSYPGNGDSGWNYGAAINVPFAGNTAALRVMGFNREAPGYVDNIRIEKEDNNKASQYGGRAMLAWEPNDDWKFSLMAATQNFSQDDTAVVNNNEGRLERDNTPRASTTEYSYSLANLGMERSFDWADLISQTSYFEKEFHAFLDASRITPGGSLPLLALAGHNKSESFSQEFRVVSAPGDGPWKWLAGAFYFQTHLYDCADAGLGTGLPNLPIPPILTGLFTNPCPGNAPGLAGTLGLGQLVADLDVSETALFGDLTRALGEHWELTLGGRAYRTESEGTVSTKGALYSAQNLLMPKTRDVGLSEDGISPKASIVFHPTDDLRLYFTASRGFRFGGPQLGASTATTQVPEVYKSDSLWNYELGLRSDWFDRSLRVDASVYRIDWKDPQVNQISQDGLITFIDNVGGVEGLGSELALRYLPPFLEGLSLNASATWSRTRTTEIFRSSSGNDVPAGSPWPLAPRWQTSTTLAYSLPVQAWDFLLSLRHSYLGQACNDIDCNAQVFGYRTLDLNLAATPQGDSWWPQLSVGLNNLTDERGISGVLSNPTLGDSTNYIAPRMLVVRVSGSF